MPNNYRLQQLVTDLLQKHIPPAYHYHNLQHTLYVQEKAAALALQEYLDKEATDLLNMAALWHDTGYINTYKGHEEESCVLASVYLAEYGYSRQDIDRICEMIMATKMPQMPLDLAGQILADADLAYLGTPDAAAQAALLFEEIRVLQPHLTQREWNRQQIGFLEQHRFFTNTYRQTMEPAKQQYLQALRETVL